MKVFLETKNELVAHHSISMSGSKSESNRLLILQQIFPNISIENLSESDDTILLQSALKQRGGKIDINHAGTAMRFLTAYFASVEGLEVELSGSKRMHERPIKILVDALRNIGGKIGYIKEEGYPPLKIEGVDIDKNVVVIPANVSSQYISALMLIGPTIKDGLTIRLEGEITSAPYIEMTSALLNEIGVACVFEGNEINISSEEKINDVSVQVESDWSSASYFYSLVAQSEAMTLSLSNYSKDSIQGDSAITTIFRGLGVETVFDANNIITLSKKKTDLPNILMLDLSNTPDIAQTIAVTCFGLGIGCNLTGLHTLKIKETDRLEALQKELSKLGAEVNITNESIEVKPFRGEFVSALIDTYNDHRMAMAFAPLSLKFPISINNPKVVSKSFPGFWEKLEELGISVTFQ